ncbi:NrsF family protein [Tardiphaga sp. 866_E4_N2_1]|uniref:NrsF family protein n=1 Tax=unclassified Tardiphaga TaxID=2631404 RepID=UPI003F20BB75
MDTDRLIETLAADNDQRPRSVSTQLAMALLVTLPVVAAMLLVTLGIRPDFMSAMRNPFFDTKFLVTLALAIPAIVISVHLSRPEASLGRWIWLLLLSPFILIVALIVEMTMPQRAPMMVRIIGRNSSLCSAAITLLSLPILGGAMIALRHGAPSRPAVAGALAGLMSAGLGATFYAAHCADDSPLFVATWYTLAALVVAALGAAIGSKVLRY